MQTNAKRIFTVMLLTLVAMLAFTCAYAQDKPSGDSDEPATKVAPAANAQTPDTSSAPNAPAATPDYQVGEDDTLQISVWKEPELSVAATVRPDGSISLPLVNEVKVAGMTTTAIQHALEEKYKKFLTDPHVFITVSQIRSRKVFITGEIPRPGSYPLVTPTTVLQLIAQAGGFTQFSNRKHIFVLRKEDGHQVRLNFNYFDVVKGSKPEQNVLLRSGDTVVVP